MWNKCITHRQCVEIPLHIGIVCCRKVSDITGTFWHTCLDEALQGDQKVTAGQCALMFGMPAMKCSWLEIAECIYNDPSLSTKHVSVEESYQVEHRQDNDDRRGDGGQWEAHTRPLYHCLWHSWQPLAPGQFLWREALQRIKRSEEKHEERQNQTRITETGIHLQMSCVSDTLLVISTEGICLRGANTACQGLNVRCPQQVSRLAIERYNMVNARHSFHATLPFSDWLILPQWNMHVHVTHPI